MRRRLRYKHNGATIEWVNWFNQTDRSVNRTQSTIKIYNIKATINAPTKPFRIGNFKRRNNIT